MRIVFQGDSVTDCQRDRGNPHSLGCGYVREVVDVLKAEGVVFSGLNRGIAGNRIRDLADRWDEDCLRLDPDLLSVLIGVNDVWRHFDEGQLIDHDAIRLQYRDLLERVAERSPRLILMEPFLIPSAPEKACFRPILDPVIRIVRELAVDFHATLVPLDGLFAAACTWRPAKFWAEDGVHPTPAGHRLIADAWLDAFHSLAAPKPSLTHYNQITSP